jgi:hypothetical protein
MRRLGNLAGILMVSCLLVGCGSSGESTATPENLDAAVAAVKKMKKQSDDFTTEQAKSTSASKGKGGEFAPKSPRKN